VAAELYGRGQGVPLSDLLAELEGEDLDRVLQAIAMVERRQLTVPESPEDLWIRAAEPYERSEQEAKSATQGLRTADASGAPRLDGKLDGKSGGKSGLGLAYVGPPTG
jgi:hypothetical protein